MALHGTHPLRKTCLDGEGSNLGLLLDLECQNHYSKTYSWKSSFKQLEGCLWRTRAPWDPSVCCSRQQWHLSNRPGCYTSLPYQIIRILSQLSFSTLQQNTANIHKNFQVASRTSTRWCQNCTVWLPIEVAVKNYNFGQETYKKHWRK